MHTCCFHNSLNKRKSFRTVTHPSTNQDRRCLTTMVGHAQVFYRHTAIDIYYEQNEVYIAITHQPSLTGQKFDESLFDSGNAFVTLDVVTTVRQRKNRPF